MLVADAVTSLEELDYARSHASRGNVLFGRFASLDRNISPHNQLCWREDAKRPRCERRREASSLVAGRALAARVYARSHASRGNVLFGRFASLDRNIVPHNQLCWRKDAKRPRCERSVGTGARERSLHGSGACFRAVGRISGLLISAENDMTCKTRNVDNWIVDYRLLKLEGRLNKNLHFKNQQSSIATHYSIRRGLISCSG